MNESREEKSVGRTSVPLPADALTASLLALFNRLLGVACDFHARTSGTERSECSLTTAPIAQKAGPTLTTLPTAASSNRSNTCQTAPKQDYLSLLRSNSSQSFENFCRPQSLLTLGASLLDYVWYSFFPSFY